MYTLDHPYDGPHYSFHTGKFIVTADNHCKLNDDQAIAWDGNDMIMITLDMKNARIGCKLKNEMRMHWIFENIRRSPDIKYKLAVSLLNVNTCLTLIDFEIV